LVVHTNKKGQKKKKVKNKKLFYTPFTNLRHPSRHYL